jgi:tRNA-Thr(GGU) m(6)t(6)A37 methyltransferase TsaA
MNTIIFKPIGVIHSPFKSTEEIPRQSIYADKVRATIELNKDLIDGLYTLEEYSHIVILFYFHQAKPCQLQQRSRHDHNLRGVFATRSPARPNPIGLTISKLISIKENVLEIEGIDMLDGTPVLDIKPYSPGLNPPEADPIDQE